MNNVERIAELIRKTCAACGEIEKHEEEIDELKAAIQENEADIDRIVENSDYGIYELRQAYKETWSMVIGRRSG